MGNQAKVLDPGIFDELKAALAKFESEAGDSVRSAERAIQETRDWLEERVGHWNSEINRRKQEVQRAQDALKRCQSSAQSSDNQGKKEQKKDCSAETQAVVQAKRALEEANANLKVAKKWKDDLANLEPGFRAKAQGFQQSLNSQVSSASKGLISVQRDLERYLQSQALSSATLGMGLGASLANQQSSNNDNNNTARWNHQDGTGYHQLVEEAVEDKFDQTAVHDDPQKDRVVESEKELSDGKQIDTLITKGEKGIVIDYKTHDMSSWTQSDAIRFANEVGEQVRHYTQMQYDGVPLDTQGVVILCNNLPKDERVFHLVRDGLSQYGVTVEVADGTVASVVKCVGKIIKSRGM